MKRLIPEEFPPQLQEIAGPPKQLYIEGTLPPPETLMLCVVGARKNTPYGKDVCEKLIRSLKGRNICIVSGLAVGIDTIAHKTAIEIGLPTIGVPGSGLSRKVLYPQSNRAFADTIIETGGALLSEFEPDFVSTQWAFPMRNRIMAGLCKAVLIIEAEKKSGTLITARLATEYNRDVLTVPGSIFSKNSEGPHLLLKLGATPISSIETFHEALGFQPPDTQAEITYNDCSKEELLILNNLEEALPRDELIRTINIPTHQAQIMISLLEMKGYITEHLGLIRKINK